MNTSDKDMGQLKVRLPHELKAWLAAKADENRRSLTSEVTVRLEASREARPLRDTKGEAPVIGPTEASMKNPQRQNRRTSHDRE